MKILADANVETALVRWLRGEGHDVVWALDFPSSCSDADVLSTATEQDRVVLTYDRDFGELVFLKHRPAHGVVLLRFDATFQAQRLALLQTHWSTIEQHVTGSFVVVANERVRIRRLGSETWTPRGRFRKAPTTDRFAPF